MKKLLRRFLKWILEDEKPVSSRIILTDGSYVDVEAVVGTGLIGSSKDGVRLVNKTDVVDPEHWSALFEKHAPKNVRWEDGTPVTPEDLEINRVG